MTARCEGTTLKSLLDNFAICSGLKVNLEKTKAYNINGKIPDQNYGLKWPEDEIELLGLTVTDDQKVNYEKNLAPKLTHMHTLLNIWRQRNLSLKGKIVVINSLIISLFVYPISIIDVPSQVIIEIDKAIFKFLWSGKPPKIARNVVQSQIAEGGLKMPDIATKAEAWKVMWIKRAIQNPEKIWVKILDKLLVKIKFIDLLRSDIVENKELYKNLPNFFIDILKTWKKLHIIKSDTAPEIKKQMIWFNSNITIENKPFIWEDWYVKGVVEIADILDKNNDFLSSAKLNEKYNLNCNFLQSLQIRKSLPYNWRQTLTNESKPYIPIEHPYRIKYKNYNINMPEAKSINCYWSLMKDITRPPSAIAKWEEVFKEDILEWKFFYRNPFRTTSETKLQSFQYKILHRITACNHWLHIVGVKTENSCNYCKLDDTIVHFFIHCNTVELFWQSFSNWFSRIIGNNIEIKYKDILLGINGKTNRDKTLNYCILLAKFHIYTKKVTDGNNDISLYSYLVLLKGKLNDMYVYYKQENKVDEFNTKWSYITESL